MGSEYKKCENGHYYQGSRCPFCRNAITNPVSSIKYDFLVCFHPDDYSVAQTIAHELHKKGYKVCSHDTKIQLDKDPDIIRNIQQSKLILFFLSQEDNFPQYLEILKHAHDSHKTVLTIQSKTNSSDDINSILQFIYSFETTLTVSAVSNTSNHFINSNSNTNISNRTCFIDGKETDEYVYNTNPNQIPNRSLSYNPFISKYVGALHDLNNKNSVYRIYEGRNIIGSDSDCTITLNDSSVSCKHAVLLFRAGKFSIVDQQSSYGTFVNGEDIEFEPRYLKNGDIISFGHSQFTFESFIESQIKECTQTVYASIFAPAEAENNSHLLIQLYLHLYEETKKIIALAQESQQNTKRRDYIPLQCKLKEGDVVDVQLSIYGRTLLSVEKKSLIWQGSFTKCSFGFYVSDDLNVRDLNCVAILSIKGIPVGEMSFIIKIEDSPKQRYTEIFARKYKKIFISYAHQDEEKVRFFPEGLKLLGMDYFFDRHYLQTGDIFPQIIQDYINQADLFVLFWSENASKSKYVEKELAQALERAFPKIQPYNAAKISIYPLSIEPRAELPSDIQENYQFGMM